MTSCYSIASSQGYSYIDGFKVVNGVVMHACVRRDSDRGKEGVDRIWVGFNHNTRKFVIERTHPTEQDHDA